MRVQRMQRRAAANMGQRVRRPSLRDVYITPSPVLQAIELPAGIADLDASLQTEEEGGSREGG